MIQQTTKFFRYTAQSYSMCATCISQSVSNLFVELTLARLFMLFPLVSIDLCLFVWLNWTHTIIHADQKPVHLMILSHEQGYSWCW